jgi:thioredoxin 1
MASDLIQTYTDDNFDSSVLKAATPVVVDFWAEWCGPCRALGPAIDALARDYQGKVAVGKLNVDDNPNTTMLYMVRGIPAVLLFKGGKMVDQIVGLVDKGTLKQMVDKHLA